MHRSQIVRWLSLRPRTVAYAYYSPPEEGAGAGGGGGGTGDPGKEDPPKEDPPKPAQKIELTPEQLDQRLQRASAAATSKLLTDAGFDNAEAFNAFMKAQKDKADAEKTELERAQGEVATAKQESDRAKAELKAEKVRTAVITAAGKNGIPADRLDHVARLVDASAITVGDDGSITGADEAIKALVEGAPWLTAGAPKGPVGAGADGGAGGNGGKADALSAEEQWAAKVTGVKPDAYGAAKLAKPGDANASYVEGAAERARAQYAPEAPKQPEAAAAGAETK